MKINWKVRIRSRKFWVALAAFIGLLLSKAGVMDIGEFQLYADGLFYVLLAAGVIVDPTTEGLSDSKRALTYDKPRSDK